MRALLAALAAVVLAACEPIPERSAPPQRRASAPSAVFSPPAGFTKLRWGLVPFLSKETIVANHQKLADYLAKTLSVPVELTPGDSYGDAIDRLERGEFDLVELSPYAYALATTRVKLNCVVQTIADGSVTAAGYVFVRDDSPRRTIDDLKGANFGFVDPVSTSGYLFPWKLLRERGLDPKKDFAKVEFLGSHDAVLAAVHEGRVDAGATYQGAFATIRRTRGIDPLSFRVIAKTLRTPRDIICVRPEVPAEVADAIGHTLLGLTGRDRAGREILGPLGINGFQPANDANYADVRRVAAELAKEE